MSGRHQSIPEENTGDSGFFPASPLREHIARFGLPFGLTATELRVVMTAVQGSSRSEAAESIGCSEATLSWHWQNIFRRTRLRSQRELLAAIIRDIANAQRPRT